MCTFSSIPVSAFIPACARGCTRLYIFGLFSQLVILRNAEEDHSILCSAYRARASLVPPPRHPQTQNPCPEKVKSLFVQLNRDETELNITTFHFSPFYNMGCRKITLHFVHAVHSVSSHARAQHHTSKTLKNTQILESKEWKKILMVVVVLLCLYRIDWHRVIIFKRMFNVLHKQFNWKIVFSVCVRIVLFNER